MMATLLRLHWLNLKRDYAALGLSFLLPLIFFTIFAFMFGGTVGDGDDDGGARMQAIDILLVDLDQTELSSRFSQVLGRQEALNVQREQSTADGSTADAQARRKAARQRVRSGNIPVAIIIPSGFSETFGQFGETEVEPVEVVYDAANPVARHTVAGLLQAAAMQAAPDALMERGMRWLDDAGGGLTGPQREAIDELLPYLRGERSWTEEGSGSPTAAGDEATGDEPDQLAEQPPADAIAMRGLIRIATVPAHEAAAGEEVKTKRRPRTLISYYAAGIGVMFLLFSMAGAAGSLLEEEEIGTLERLLTSNVSMMTLLLSSWIFFAAMGFIQVAMMFVFGALVFDVELWTVNHLMGFLVMTIVTAASASALGIALATLCRSRAQLGAISTIVILTMSAIGGSMMPRIFMPEVLKKAGLFTFNGWALDGYLKVFWYDSPEDSLLTALTSLWPQVAVLSGLTILFLVMAGVAAKRWEAS